mmetsp:Transcript_1915/g.5516  ORF Transcript_1915/g.5516 Transcript_1915/m.5516 type:complete len:371 (-) Transcript_1915:1037-2149(-)
MLQTAGSQMQPPEPPCSVVVPHHVTFWTTSCAALPLGSCSYAPCTQLRSGSTDGGTKGGPCGEGVSSTGRSVSQGSPLHRYASSPLSAEARKASRMNARSVVGAYFCTATSTTSSSEQTLKQFPNAVAQQNGVCTASKVSQVWNVVWPQQYLVMLSHSSAPIGTSASRLRQSEHEVESVLWRWMNTPYKMMVVSIIASVSKSNQNHLRAKARPRVAGRRHQTDGTVGRMPRSIWTRRPKTGYSIKKSVKTKKTTWNTKSATPCEPGYRSTGKNVYETVPSLPSKVTSTHSESVLPPAARMSSTEGMSTEVLPVSPPRTMPEATLPRGSSRSSMLQVKAIRTGHSSRPPDVLCEKLVAITQRVSLASAIVA